MRHRMIASIGVLAVAVSASVPLFGQAAKPAPKVESKHKAAPPDQMDASFTDTGWPTGSARHLEFPNPHTARTTERVCR